MQPTPIGLANPVNIFDRTDPDYNTIGLSFTAGKYNVWVQSTFTYYDYDRLVPGSTPASRAEIISPLLTALGTTNDSPYAYPGTLGWSMAQIEIASASIASFPGGAGVIMSGKWLGGSNYSYSPTSTDPTSTPVYIIEEGATWSFKLRDKAENIGTTNDRLAAILATNAPTPNDTEADPTSLDWDGPPTFKWTARLEHPVTNAGILQSADVYPNDSFSPSIEIPQALEKRFLSVPSDPVAYVLEVDVLRFYKYMTRVIVGTVQTGINPETGAPVFGLNYQNTWIRPNIQLKAQATIIVLDKTPPALTLLEPYQQQAMPAMGLIARTTGPTAESTVLWGTTGDSIQSPEGKSNPSTLQFVVADNNPFGNYSQTNTYTDSHSGLSCRHNVSKRAGTFIYQTATGTSLNPQIVWAHPSAPETYRDDNDSHGGSFQMQNLTVPSTLLSQTSPTAVYNSSTFSYLTYTMNLSALQHFSRDPANGNAWSGKVPMNYANNLPYYSNPTYGAWFTDSSGNTMVASWTSAGIIVIRDNKKPNVAVQAIDDKTLTARVVPFLSGTIPVGYDRTSVDKFLIAPEYTQMNETTSWGTTAINGFVSIDWPWRPGSGNAQFTFQGAGLDGAQEIGYEQDVPISFQSCISDNVSPVASMTTSWTISGGAFDSPLSIPSNPWRYLFRQAATYTMSLSLNDTARGWPSDPANPYSTAEAAPNDRTLNIVIPISATRLDLRVIEKQMR
ncbi:hypothetical protein KBA41_01045 [Candidatus Ozemobacteraceae bacterium]|nr:hypothetical protein [Candidatus Ozemobacteraceae bacterium]